MRIKILKNVKKNFWLKIKEIESLQKIIEKKNQKMIAGNLTKNDIFLLKINKSSLVIMLYGFVERLISVVVNEIYSHLKKENNLNYSMLLPSLKRHITDNLMKIADSKRKGWFDSQGDFLYHDLYNQKNFPILHCLLIDYDGIKKPMCISDNIKYNQIKDIFTDFKLWNICHLKGEFLSPTLESLLRARNILSHWWKSFEEYWGTINLEDLKKWIKDIKNMYNTIIPCVESYLVGRKYISHEH